MVVVIVIINMVWVVIWFILFCWLVFIYWVDKMVFVIVNFELIVIIKKVIGILIEMVVICFVFKCFI